MSNYNLTNAKMIYSILINTGFSAVGACAILGNLYAESALIPTNLQNSYEKKLGYSDSSYTQAVDNGTYKNFSSDSAGYGLAQWTFSARKANLLNFAKQKNKSIGDLEMQTEFLVHELQASYMALYKALQTATDIQTASDMILTQYERPADMSSTVKNKRAGYAKTYYQQFVTSSNETSTNSKYFMITSDGVTYAGNLEKI